MPAAPASIRLAVLPIQFFNPSIQPRTFTPSINILVINYNITEELDREELATTRQESLRLHAGEGRAT
jgi:hypothetical protein